MIGTYYTQVYENNLTGKVPPSIYNITSLIDLTLTQNRLQGSIPPIIGFTFPNLNNFSGPIPTSFANISYLQLLDISGNSLTGMIPHELGRLKDLRVLNFDTNRLGSGKAGDLNFISLLANCTNLMDLGLIKNRLGGALPPTIGNLSDRLTRITLGENMLSGSIPSGIENLISLQILGMEYNHLSGRIPPSIGKLQNSGWLYLDENNLTGPIPSSSIGNLSSISRLYIDHNRLEGSIPPSLGRCKSLQALDLTHNTLTGSIPKEILGLPSLSVYLGLDHNSLTGPLPSEVGNLVSLSELNVSENKLSGNIPSNVGNCRSMESLSLEGNQFTGIIPPSFEALRGLEELDLSANNLSGSIPQFLANLRSLNYLNLSYNNLEGKVPKEGVFSNSTMIFVLGNKNLCDGLPELHLPPCMPNQTHLSNKRFLASRVLIPIASVVTFTVILVCIIFVCFVLKKSRKNGSTSSSSKGFLPQISYLELSKSTNGFCIENIIGSGSFGCVVLNLRQQGASKSFVDECNALSNIRHRNLLKIITSCSSIDEQGNGFKALVFNFMSNGNLDCWLHPANQGHNQRRLSFIQRLNVAIDIACGLDYLHNLCEIPIVHCDLKPSNILLDDDMVAHVGDFGISMEGDIFSYGILLLEMIIGKRPTDDMFGNGVGIHLLSRMAVPQDAMAILDPCMLPEETREEEEKEERIEEMVIRSAEDGTERVPRWMEECVVSMLRIGISCSCIAPADRMSMNVVINELQAIKSSYLKFTKPRPSLNSPNGHPMSNFQRKLQLHKATKADDSILLVLANPAVLSRNMRRNPILCILLYHTFLLSLSSTSANESDRLALLDFKSRVLNDPFGIMSSWNDSTHFCGWDGVTCNFTLWRVVVLELEARKISGSIPTSFGNMTHLTEIRLGDNKFHGHIPHEFGRLLQLRHLNLSFNDFSGEIPANISHCTELVVLEFGINGLVGHIPRQLFMLTKLERLGFGVNNLIGTIPPWIANFSSLSRMSLTYNNFQGNIPEEFGRLTRLDFFSVSVNYLTGTVPPSIYNITSLAQLYLTNNRLQGNIPPNIGFTLPNLRVFAGGGNNFTGPIPMTFANISGLQVLDLPKNSFTGMLPDELGRLKGLERLNFEDNRLGSGGADDLNFISSLANCTSLKGLGLSRNRFGGALPSSIGNLSKQLTVLNLGGNRLSGSIPSEIVNLINLQIFAVEYNYGLNGSVPSNIGNLRNLVMLLLQGNKLSGSIPPSIGNLSSITKLCMNDNRLEGSIPTSLGQCNSLIGLDLSGNRLSGAIPKEVLRLSSLSVYLALNNNSFTGPLPLELGELVRLTLLDVSKNRLSGNISSNLGKCVSMLYLDLSGNQFEGTIPQSLEALQGLEVLNLSSNNLSGSIPQFLGNLHSLKYVNLSYNNFEGKVPKEGVFSNSTMISVLGNNNLCDGLQELHLPSCPPSRTHSSTKFSSPKVLIPVVSTVIFTVVLLSILYVCYKLKKGRSNASTSSSFMDFLPQISYFELSRATDRFSVDNFIGSGSFGSVYKGILSNDGSVVAIKVLNLQQHGASKSFLDECKALASIRHRNLLKIITTCSSTDEQGNEFKALIYNFMSNGNLDGWLHPTNHEHNERRLSFIQRLNVAIDIACGLDYLHNHCETSIVHCDLKPSNILLDEDMVAHIGDFGLAKFMLEGSNYQSSFSQTMSLALKGSIGYIPPEYGIGGRISIEGDIFSFGILLLEMIIGKRPTDDMFGDDGNIHELATVALCQGMLAIVDPSLFEESFQQEQNEDIIQEIAIMSEEDRKRFVPRWMEECVVSATKIGLSCSSPVPGERTPINVVINELQSIKSSYLKFNTPTQKFHRYLLP
ncbi:putative receptor-like protein kinase At3g47110 [Cucurbita maxima]|uniref:non-specific serine/threonine protein kinase n=1 Tax=Cucurbita maxima TaxID=3661 RepID=A0A6J1J743_CUCMA|nr:putative receptor-like protein kinase At3g47110 [Cucurbita maxima]